MRLMPWFAIRKRLFLLTKDDWQPSYRNQYAMVQVAEGWRPQRPDDFYLHIGVYGAGDFGLHRWVKADPYSKASKRRKLLMEANSLPEPISIKWLLKHGYDYC